MGDVLEFKPIEKKKECLIIHISNGVHSESLALDKDFLMLYSSGKNNGRNFIDEVIYKGMQRGDDVTVDYLTVAEVKPSSHIYINSLRQLVRYFK